MFKKVLGVFAFIVFASVIFLAKSVPVCECGGGDLKEEQYYYPPINENTAKINNVCGEKPSEKEAKVICDFFNEILEDSDRNKSSS
ncbi:MAG: hypothetical protein LBT82_02775 [Oscillospiraceae bacterium]|jgi:hypothetical protein|nr:hypothetical protein [Oscillospiraceae bacterium]